MQIGEFIFGMRGHDLGDSFEDMCKNADATNVRDLQFALAKTMSDIDFDTKGYSEDISAKVTESFRKYDINVSVLGCYIDPITQQTLDTQLSRFENFIRYARDFNATVIGTETGSLGSIEANHSDEGFKRFIKSLERLVPVAEKYNVNIGIEPVWVHTVYSVETMQRVLDYFKSDNLNVIFDPVNLLYDENHMKHSYIVEQAIDTFGSKIKSVHLKDYIYDNGIKRAMVGAGEFDIKHCLKEISRLDTVPAIMLDEMPMSALPTVTENLKRIIL